MGLAPVIRTTALAVLLSGCTANTLSVTGAETSMLPPVTLSVFAVQPESSTASAAVRMTGASPIPAHFIVGITNSAPSLVPVGQRDVTVLVLV